MQNHKALRVAGLLGTITATAGIAITLPDLLENIGYITLAVYTIGVIMLTNRFNHIYRGK
jgi:hypothetical protein